MDVERSESAPAPSPQIGFWAAVAVNTLVAVVFWVAVSHEHGYDWVGNYYGEWLWPVAVFLVVVVVPGFVALAISRWRRFGVGLIAGAVTVALADVVWTFVYFVGEGS